jgi:hypothetical protein
VDYCINPGGKMAGQTIDEARATQRAAQNKQVNLRDNQNNRNYKSNTQMAHVAGTVPGGDTSGIEGEKDPATCTVWVLLL